MRKAGFKLPAEYKKCNRITHRIMGQSTTSSGWVDPAKLILQKMEEVPVSAILSKWIQILSKWKKQPRMSNPFSATKLSLVREANSDESSQSTRPNQSDPAVRRTSKE